MSHIENKVTKIWESQGYKATFTALIINAMITNPTFEITDSTGNVVHEKKNFDGWNTRNMDYNAYTVFKSFMIML
jgi:hypothetical protein